MNKTTTRYALTEKAIQYLLLKGIKPSQIAAMAKANAQTGG